jgi:hypothetical protein
MDVEEVTRLFEELGYTMSPPHDGILAGTKGIGSLIYQENGVLSYSEEVYLPDLTPVFPKQTTLSLSLTPYGQGVFVVAAGSRVTGRGAIEPLERVLTCLVGALRRSGDASRGSY